MDTIQSASQEQSKQSVFDHVNKNVYTSEGVYVGTVDEVFVSFESHTITGLGLRDMNQTLLSEHTSQQKFKIDSDIVLGINDIILTRKIEPEEIVIL